MSLLLDALNRASQDKAAAAAVRVTASTRDEMALELPEPAPKATVAPLPHGAPPDAAPGNDWPTLGLALTPTEATPTMETPAIQLGAGGTRKPLDTGMKLVAKPEPPAPEPAPLPPPQPPQPPRAPERQSEPPMAFASLPKLEPHPAPSGTRPAPNNAPRVAQSIVRAKAPSPTATVPARLIVLVSIAVLLAAGLGSVLLGSWGDPMVWLQPSAVNGPITQPTAMATVIAPASPVNAVEIAPTPPAPPAAIAATNPGQTQVKARPESSNRSADEVKPSARPATAVATVRVINAPSECAPGLTPAECETAIRRKPATAPARSDSPMLQSRSTGPSALESGYAALTQGRLQEAKQAYKQALAGNPEERDALLGLAYIAHQQGHAEEARAYYQRVLRQEPGNAIARAGLLTLNPTDDAQALGSQSRDVAEQNPDSAAAQSVLGHSLVRQGRLADARLAFQRAHLLEPNVALHAFNLAVALDRLRNYAAARHYYELALALSAQSGGERSSGVQHAVVQERLVQLQAAGATDPAESRP